MRVVIPEDPFWAELFATVDAPLLHNLTWLSILPPREERAVKNAYAAYDRVLHQLPPDVRHLVLSHVPGQEATISGRRELPRRHEPVAGQMSLYRADGQPLTPMHVIDVATDDLVALVTLQAHLASNDAPRFGDLQEAVRDLESSTDQSLADVYRRTLGVLTLIPPLGLLEALAPEQGSGDGEVTLSKADQAAYDTHRDRIIEIISGHSADVTACHRMLYT